MFSAGVREAAAAEGAALEIIDSEEKFEEALERLRPTLFLADLHHRRLGGEEAGELVRKLRGGRTDQGRLRRRLGQAHRARTAQVGGAGGVRPGDAALPVRGGNAGNRPAGGGADAGGRVTRSREGERPNPEPREGSLVWWARVPTPEQNYLQAVLEGYDDLGYCQTFGSRAGKRRERRICLARSAHVIRRRGGADCGRFSKLSPVKSILNCPAPRLRSTPRSSLSRKGRPNGGALSRAGAEKNRMPHDRFPLSSVVSAILLVLGLWADAPAAERLKLATTTSTENSGLLDRLHPAFERRRGVRVHAIAVGTGKALRLGRNGDVDVVLVHARKAEELFVARGYGVRRRSVHV